LKIITKKGKNFLPLFIFLRYNQIMIIPTVLEKSATGERAYDLYSRLLKDRIIFLGEEVNEHSMNLCIMQMLFLDREDPHMAIEFYINSPGGSVVDGLALYDVMHTISAPVNTTCVGTAASMGAILLCGGTGTRSALPNSRIMIHQVSSGARGKSADLRIQMAETDKLENILFQILADKTGKTLKQIAKDCDRDYYLSSEEAKAYGLIDSVIENKKTK
jgi:ATP-dependent Clp protease protease subunit